MTENQHQNEQKENLVGSAFLDFLYTIAKYRKFLFLFISVIVSGAILLAVFTPKEYKATASVLPAAQSDILSSLSGISSLAKSFTPLRSLGGLSGSDETDKYFAILKSKNVQHRLINEYDMKKVYNLENEPMWKIEKALSENLNFELETEGNILIEVYDTSPERAAKMANFLVSLLNEINTELHITNARSTREFIEKRYIQNTEDIANLEIQMKDFQEKYGVIAVPEQIEATVKSMAELYVDLAREEVALKVLKQTLSEDNPLLVTKELEYKEINEKINKMGSGNLITEYPKVFIPLNVAPGLVNKYLNIYKNLEIQYTIAEFITPVYEQAKIEEVRSTPSVLVLDTAYPPERKARPKIALYALIGFVISLVIGLFIVLMLELLRKLSEINPEKFEYVYNAFRPFSKLFIRQPMSGKS
jgi:tyrosine-protein kinase Etk/Wzc